MPIEPFAQGIYTLQAAAQLLVHTVILIFVPVSHVKKTFAENVFHTAARYILFPHPLFV